MGGAVRLCGCGKATILRSLTGSGSTELQGEGVGSAGWESVELDGVVALGGGVEVDGDPRMADEDDDLRALRQVDEGLDGAGSAGFIEVDQHLVDHDRKAFQVRRGLLDRPEAEGEVKLLLSASPQVLRGLSSTVIALSASRDG